MGVSLALAGCYRAGFEGDDHRTGDGGTQWNGGGSPPTSLTPPLLESPADNAVLPTTLPMFAWQDTNGRDDLTFALSVSTAPDCTGNVGRRVGLITSYQTTPGDGLWMGATLYWCVRARHPSGIESDWSLPRRLGLRPLRLRIRETAPHPVVGSFVASDPAREALVVAGGFDDLGQVLDVATWFEPRVERWLAEHMLQPLRPLQGVRFQAGVADPMRGDSLVMRGSWDTWTEPGLADQIILSTLDSSFGGWVDLALDPTSPPLRDDCRDGSMAYDSARDRIMILQVACADNSYALWELDRTGAMARLSQVTPTGGPRSLAGNGQAAFDPESGALLVTGEDLDATPRTDVLDLALGEWLPVDGNLGARAFITVHPLLGTLVAIDATTPYFYLWNNRSLTWEPMPVEVVAGPYSGRPNGSGALVAGNAVWFAFEAFPSRLVAAVLEPDDRPVLTLRGTDTHSVDGTELLEIAVEISRDDEAVAWLLEETGIQPAVDDLRWVEVQPTTFTLGQDREGLHTVHLWLEYSHRTVGSQPGVASIWRLVTPPSPPTFTLYATDWVPGSPPSNDETSSGDVTALLSDSFEGLVAFSLGDSTRDQIPLPRRQVYGSFGLVAIEGQVTDAAGHVSELSTDDIWYRDTRAPRIIFDDEDGGTYNVVAGNPVTLTWSANDDTPPISSDVRISSVEDCSGDIVAVDGFAGVSLDIETNVLIPGRNYFICVRGTDSAVPQNTSAFELAPFRYQATPARWHPLSPLPDALGYVTAAYDTTRGRIMVFGGFDSGGYINTLRSYDSLTDSWSGALSTSGPRPQERGGARAFYDDVDDQLILFGGFYAGTTGIFYDDTYALSLSTNTWTDLAPPPGPSARGCFAAVYSSADRQWLIGVGLFHNHALAILQHWIYDQDTNVWTEAQGIDRTYYTTGYLMSFGPNGLPAIAHRGDIFQYDFPTMTQIPLYTWEHYRVDSPHYIGGSAWDDATGGVVQYLEWSEPTSSQTRRTYFIDIAAGARFMTGADNILDRAYSGFLRDPVRRSVVMIGGFVVHGGGDTWTLSGLVAEFRFHGGPRVFASDPSTGSEATVSGPSVDLAIGWDESATAWLVTEQEWPAPATSDSGWVGTRPTSYTFPDGTLGSRTVYVWIKDGPVAVVLDSGRWTIERF